MYNVMHVWVQYLWYVHTVLLEYFSREKTFANEPNQQKMGPFCDICVLARIVLNCHTRINVGFCCEVVNTRKICYV